MKSTLTAAERNAISAFLVGKHIPSGLGTAEGACSIASINLALSGKLIDTIPDCMSPIIGRWIIVIQDEMPSDMRNSQEWRILLPLAAGTGRDPVREDLRLEAVLNWMWDIVLPSFQPVADKYAFSVAWQYMCNAKTAQSAADAATAAADAATAAYKAAEAAQSAAYKAADAADAATAADAAYKAADAAQSAADAAQSAQWVAADAATAAYKVADAATAAYKVADAATAAYKVADAATAAYKVAEAAQSAVTWQNFDPIKLLKHLIAL